MRRRGQRTGKGPGWIAALFAGHFLVVIPAAAGAQPGNLGATLKRLGYEQVELRRTGENHLFLFGHVNGHRRSCLVDTGWSFTTVSTNTAPLLVTPGIVQELRLGRVTITNAPVVVQDLRVNGQPTAFNVVVGCDFLIHHHAIIDCAGQRLYLRREPQTSGPFNQLTAALEQRGLVAVNLTRHEPPALTCAAKINGRDVELLVDTGAMWSCLDTETARMLELRTDPAANQITGAGAGGKRAFGVTRVKTFEMGGRESTGMNFAVLPLGDWGLGTNGQVLNSVGGILGGDQLAVEAAVIDCGQLKLWRNGRK